MSRRRTKAETAASFGAHLAELRVRVAWVALTFVVASALAYNVRDQLVAIVLAPIGSQKLVYLTPGGGFSFIFQITMYAGMLVAAPVAIYQLYRFVAPAFPEGRRWIGLSIVLAATALMATGASFAHFVAIPGALRFLTTFADGFVTANLTADSYLSFVVAYILGLGLLFELPLLLLLWNWIAPIKPGGLLGSQRFVIVGAFIAAAAITPTPDAMNQSLIALPIIGVYQFGVVAVWLTSRRARRSRPRSLATTARVQSPGTRSGAVPTTAVQRDAIPAVSPAPTAQAVTVRARPLPSMDGFRRVPPVQPRPPAALAQATRRPLPVVVVPRERQSARSGVSIDGFDFV